MQKHCSNAQPKEKKHNNKHAGLAAGNESYSNHKMICFFFKEIARILKTFYRAYDT